MTKEFELTTRGQNTYSGSMTNEPGMGETQPVNPQEQRLLNPAPEPRANIPERSQTIRDSWDRYNRRYFESRGGTRNMGINEIRGQEQVSREMIERGITPEEAYVPAYKTGEAVWRSEGADQPVNITGYLGPGPDGRQYVSIEGSSAGVPFDEVAFAGGGGEEPPQEPPTAAGGGAGGEEPPQEPPAGSPEEVPQPGGEGNRGRSGEFTPQFGIAEFEEELVVNVLKAAEAGFRYGHDDETKYRALTEALDRVHLISAEHREGESEQEASRIGRLKAEKALAEERIKEQIEEWQLDRAAQLDRPEHKRTLPAEWEPIRANLVREISSGEDYPLKMDKIERIIDDLDPNDRSYTAVITAALREVEKNRELDPIIEDTLEYSLERFLSRADGEAQAQEDYPQWTFAESENISVIQQAGRVFDKARRDAGVELGTTPGRKEMFSYLTTLASRRRIMHELFKSMNDLESFTGIVTRALRKNGMAFIEKQLVGVSDIQIEYDKVMPALKSLKPQEKGWLLEADFQRGDQIVREHFSQSLKDNPEDFYKSYIEANGGRGKRALREWEINRAFYMGRALNGASQRRVVYAILGDVPKNADEFLKSVAHEPIGRRLAPLKLIPDRFFSQPAARRFIEILKNEQRRGVDGKINYGKYGYQLKDEKGNILVGENGEPQTRGIFGSSQGDFAILDLGIVDPKTSSWRSRLMFLKNSRFQTEQIDGKATTLGDFLDTTKARATSGADHHERRHRIEGWNESIRDVISNQRLFLGVLARYGDLSADNKKIVWGNTAKLLPSKIASFFPNETLDMVGKQFNLEGNRDAQVERWMKIAQKLWTAERMRVSNDVKILSGEAEGPLLAISQTEDGSLVSTALDPYLERVGIDPEEMAIVRKLQSLNLAPHQNFDEILAGVKFPFTAFLDDAPETDWDETSDFDFTRILVNDQNAFQEGYGHIMGLLDNPAIKPAKAAEMLVEAFEKVKGPPGLEETQKIFEPIVRSTIKMRKMNNMSKWMGASFMRMLRKPTSPIEEFNLQAHIADDEADTAGMLHMLAQHEVVSDDPTEIDPNDPKGRTMYQRLREDTESDAKAVALAYLRLLIQLFGPTFASEFMKAMGLKI